MAITLNPLDPSLNRQIEGGDRVLQFGRGLMRVSLLMAVLSIAAGIFYGVGYLTCPYVVHFTMGTAPAVDYGYDILGCMVLGGIEFGVLGMALAFILGVGES